LRDATIDVRRADSLLQHRPNGVIDFVDLVAEAIGAPV
jgi:hypothetical protein